MPDYQRILSYLYRYDNHVKMDCRGFVKAEQRPAGLKLTIQVKDERLMEDMAFFLCFFGQKDGAWRTFCPGSVKTARISGEFVLFYASEHLPAGFDIKKEHGILLYYQDSFFYGSVWIGEEIPIGELAIGQRPAAEAAEEGLPLEKEPEPSENVQTQREVDSEKKVAAAEESETRETEREAGSSPENLTESGPVAAEREKAISSDAQPQDENNFVTEKTDSEVLKASGTSSVPGSGKDSLAAPEGQTESEQILTEREEAVPENTQLQDENNFVTEKDPSESSEGSEASALVKMQREAGNSPEEPGTVPCGPSETAGTESVPEAEEDVAEKTTSPEIESPDRTPSLPEEIRSRRITNIFNPAFLGGYSITLEELALFGEEAGSLKENPFLSRGFGRYQHLLAGKVRYAGEERGCAGVPGIYENRERYMAEIYGFPVFLSLTENRIKTGCFGYWLHLLS